MGWVEFNNHLKCLSGDAESTVVLQIQTQGEVQTRGLILWVRLQNPELRGKQNLCTWPRMKTGGNQKSEKPTRFSVSTLLFLPEFPSFRMWCALKLGNHSWSSVRETHARPIWTKTDPYGPVNINLFLCYRILQMLCFCYRWDWQRQREDPLNC